LGCWLICGAGLLLSIEMTGQGFPGLSEPPVGWFLAAAGWFALVVSAADWLVRTTEPAKAFNDAPAAEQPARTPGSGA
jgi:hypothetical protein